jgi:hypothetical protein
MTDEALYMHMETGSIYTLSEIVDNIIDEEIEMHLCSSAEDLAEKYINDGIFYEVNESGEQV